jgi:HAE1 family hydrophobic/amphiphilic exporter-1
MTRHRTTAAALTAAFFAASLAPLGANAQTQSAPQPTQPTAAPVTQSSAAPMVTTAPVSPTMTTAPVPMSTGSTAAGPQASSAPQSGASSAPQSGMQQQPGANSNGQSSTPGTTTQPGGTLRPGNTTAPGSTTQSGGGANSNVNGSGSSTGAAGGGAVTSGNSGAGASGAAGSNIQGGGNPPPPQPAVLPAVPNLGADLSANVNAVPNADFVGVNQQPFVGLALRDAIGMTLARNVNLAIAQSNRRIGNYQIIAAKGAYDVKFQVVPQYTHEVEPVSSPFNTNFSGGPVTMDTAGATAGFRGITQSGGNYSIGVTGTKTTSDNAYNSYNPYYTTALQLTIQQPLLKGRAIDQPRLQVQLANISASVQNANALVDASNAIVQVENAYYDLVSAWQNVAIQEEGLRQAQAQAASNGRLAARGVVAQTDIVEANTQVNVFQDNVFAAIQNVQRVQQELKQLLLANPTDPLWFANLVPTTPVAELPTEPGLNDLITAAVQNRPEIAQVRAQRDQANVQLAFAKDQLKPQLDLALGYTNNGFAGQPLNEANNPLFGLLGGLDPAAISAFPQPPAYQTGALGKSFQNALDGKFPSISTSLTFSLPIGNHVGKADYAIAQEQQKDVSLNETALIQRFRAESVNAIQGLREAEYRVIAARAARSASERVLLGEQRRFQAGTSTTFLVLQRQLDVANQRGRELQAQTDLDKAIVELERVGGGIFTRNGVDITTLGTTTLNSASSTSVLPAGSPVAAPTVRRPSH